MEEGKASKTAGDPGIGESAVVAARYGVEDIAVDVEERGYELLLAYVSRPWARLSLCAPSSISVQLLSVHL